jgi:hypothetical protein
MRTFILEHGAWVWKIGIVVGALLGLGLAKLVRRMIEGSRARAEVEARRAKVTAPVLARAEGELVLVGMVRGGMFTSGARHERTGDPWVEYSNERLTFTGDVRVVRGSRAFARRGSRKERVEDGDLVIVRGTLERMGKVDNLGVRSWIFRGGELVALSPASTGAPLHPVIALVVAAAFATGTYVAELQIGKRATAKCEAGSADACVVAAAMPR